MLTSKLLWLILEKANLLTSSGRTIPFNGNISAESSENELALSNLYKQAAIQKNFQKKLKCKVCELVVTSFDFLSEHSKKFEKYKCNYVFAKKIRNVILKESGEVKKIICRGCKSLLGKVLERGGKCSCYLKQTDKFRFGRTKVKLKV